MCSPARAAPRPPLSPHAADPRTDLTVSLARSTLIFTLALLSSSACGGPPSPRGSFHAGLWRRGEEQFRVKPLPPPWRLISAPDGDVAFHDQRSASVIAANATCRGHKDPPLQVLVNDLLVGTTEREVLLDERVPLDGREALHNVVKLRLDGVPLVYDVYVLKKDGCVYDLALVTPPEKYDASADAFVGFVTAFRGLGDAYR